MVRCSLYDAEKMLESQEEMNEMACRRAALANGYTLIGKLGYVLYSKGNQPVRRLIQVSLGWKKFWHASGLFQRRHNLLNEPNTRLFLWNRFLAI